MLYTAFSEFFQKLNPAGCCDFLAHTWLQCLWQWTGENFWNNKKLALPSFMARVTCKTTGSTPAEQWQGKKVLCSTMAHIFVRQRERFRLWFFLVPMCSRTLFQVHLHVVNKSKFAPCKPTSWHHAYCWAFSVIQASYVHAWGFKMSMY
jgi:hypothetical protein